MPLEPRRAKYLIVAVDALFGPLTNKQSLPPITDFLTLTIPALEKAYRGGWTIFFWTWRGKQHYTALVKLLQDLCLWDFCDPASDEALLIRRPKPQETPSVTKLTLLENRFGEVLDSYSSDVVIIEVDPDIANSVRSYVGDRATVHMSPSVWLNMVAVSPERLDKYLDPNHKEDSHECAVQRNP